MRIIAFVFLFLTFQILQAEKPAISANQAGYIIHMLNYLSNDYKNAVTDGKVKSADELAEMIGFASNIEKAVKELNIEPDQKDTLLKYSLEIKTKVKNHAHELSLKESCEAGKKYLLKNTGVKTFPNEFPSLSNGKSVFIGNCAKCHGDKGYGNGKDGELLDPKPRNFHDNERMRGLSPFAVFNTIRYGIEGTGMKSHPDLSDNQAWEAAFYVLSLRYSNTNNNQPKLSIEQVATNSDDVLMQLTDSASVAAIRTFQNGDSANLMAKVKEYLAQAEEACLTGDLQTADKLITLAYLEGIEPFEFQLKKSNPDLIPNIEKKIAQIHEAVNANKAGETLSAVKELDKLLDESSKAIQESDYKPYISAFMTLSILLREGLEALLVIIIFMNVLTATNLHSWKKYVHLGWISAIITGSFLWVLIGEALKASKLNVELMEGILTLTAVILLVYVGFWLHKKSSIEHWKEFIQKKIKSETGKASVWGIFSLSFLVVFREIFESILFVSTVDLQSRGAHRFYIFAGCVTAFLIIVGLYYAITKLSKKIPFKKIITLSIVVLSILTVMLIGKATHSFQEAGVIGQTFINVPTIDLLGFFPTFQTIIAQFLMAILLLVVYKKSQAN